ncbi:unnamed protein product [Durusdinium trenchii]|uniref:NECAP PHear domain-containing protein n=2 Tax=Durusdinium trenchii TaxID=1381693 RepID=A0ABP0PVV5_9DINO
MSAPVKEGASFPWTLNPTGLLNDLTVWLGLYAATIPAKELLNVILKFVGDHVIGYTRMDEGDQKVPKLEVLEMHDLCYLAVNTIVEFLGMNHTGAFLLGSSLEYDPRGFNIFNGPLAFIAVFVLNDLIYYPFHLIAHRRIFYPYCHKQHHRQFVPFRGYADAANQHPLEQMYGFSIWIGSLWIISKLLGLHAATAWFGTIAWAVLNICNHLPFDTCIHLPVPYPALPKDHNTHHRFPNTNYATLSTMTDRAFGTFRPYRAAGKAVNENDEQEIPSLREAVPSQWSFLCIGVLLFFSLLAVEAVQLGGALPSRSMSAFQSSALLLLTLSFTSWAVRPTGVAPLPDSARPQRFRLKQRRRGPSESTENPSPRHGSEQVSCFRAAMDDDELEYTLLNKREVLVYQIPPASSSTGHKADDWKKCIWRGRLRIAGKGKDLSVKLLDGGSGNLFAQCAIPNGDYTNYVERVVDSSRYFVLKITNGDRHAFIGLGFEDRNDAFDFNCTLADFKSTWIDREKEAETPQPAVPSKDLSLKEGQTIKINLPGGKNRRREEKVESGYGGGILAPPPSGGSRRQAPAPAAAAAAPVAAPAVAWRAEAPGNDFFGDFHDFQAAPENGGSGSTPQADPFPADPFAGPLRSPQASPAPAVTSPVRDSDPFGGPSRSPQAPSPAADPFGGAPAQAPWPDSFGGFSSAPAAAPAPAFKPTTAVPAVPAAVPAAQAPIRPSPARGRDPFDDLDIFK